MYLSARNFNPLLAIASISSLLSVLKNIQSSLTHCGVVNHGYPVNPSFFLILFLASFSSIHTSATLYPINSTALSKSLVLALIMKFDLSDSLRYGVLGLRSVIPGVISSSVFLASLSLIIFLKYCLQRYLSS